MTHSTHTLYLECTSGISGDMLLSALADLGVDFSPLIEELNRSFGSTYKLSIVDRQYHGICAKGIVLDLGTQAPPAHRHLSDICDRIERCRLSDQVKVNAMATFKLLAQAEADIHGVGLEDVHFHEVGADDAIIDIVGAAFAIESLAVVRVSCSEIVVGSGHVRCDHGNMPLPAPATQKLLEGMAIRQSSIRSELTTPTGAAMIKHYVSSQLPLAGTLIKSGIGSGSRALEEQANVLRASLFSMPVSHAPTVLHADHLPEVIVMETNIDDATAEVIADASGRLLDLGALDVWTESLVMKKGRSGSKVCCMIQPKDLDRFKMALFDYLPTFGLRWTSYHRCEADRSFITISLDPAHLSQSHLCTELCSSGDGYSVRVKVREISGRSPLYSPEYADCSKVAKELNISVFDVINYARHAAMSRNS